MPRNGLDQKLLKRQAINCIYESIVLLLKGSKMENGLLDMLILSFVSSHLTFQLIARNSKQNLLDI